MKGGRWENEKEIGMEKIDEGKGEGGKVKIKVKWWGIWGREVDEYLGGGMFIGVGKGDGLRKEMGGVRMGDELSGEVVEVGEGVKN